ncbi:MAG: hypothetical protein P1P83_10705 [Bacteroidales bacterium]|nr:hypothetical protein [Bacteroidales bacterium]MDT8373867.1 hypothetical protein [Bacteroidales bacterium]
MKRENIQLGQAVLINTEKSVQGSFVEIDGEKFYRIGNSDQMEDFFMTIVSDSDHWIFISSNGSLTAGRKDRDHALFPYYTVDKIHDYCGLTGSKTVILAQKGSQTFMWQPFSKELAGIYNIERRLLKSIYGNKIIFQEKNLDLELEFQYGWFTSDKYGFVRKSRIVNFGKEPVKAGILDGVQNILPSGADYNFQNEYSNLLDGYKKSELIEETKIGLFMLSSIPVDKAEPSESLNATTVWSYGLKESRVLLSERQIDRFMSGLPVQTEADIRATRGAYLLNADILLQGQQEKEWIMVCEVDQSTTDVVNLDHFLRAGNHMDEHIDADIKRGTDRLVSFVASADGLQKSSDDLCTARHFSNTLFNIMRGGIYLNNYTISVDDLLKFTGGSDQRVLAEAGALLASKGTEISLQELNLLAKQSGNATLIRIFSEYLPLTFSRRHGDPSRPWNQFSIETKNEDGSPKFDFQGNWRDIFQNWEALCISFPEFTESIISKFLNATTPDGYNPYRITRDGIDWEAPDPDDPWSYIGYWGDHQIIYLQKLAELSDMYHPGKIDRMLADEVFAYANVPYRIKPYSDIVRDPKNTIDFEKELNAGINARVEDIGSDGRLLSIDGQAVYHVNLTEKILVLLLAKLVNFIPEAGIWLNTQRPEWNDANNALVGNGASMVTLCYLRKFMHFWKNIVNRSDLTSVEVSEEVKKLFDNVRGILEDGAPLLKDGFSGQERRRFADAMGEAGTRYRQTIYGHAFSGKKTAVKMEELSQFLGLSLEYADESIRKNRRDDGLYHSYNLVSFEGGDTVTVRHLYRMLEGQVAVLSAGCLTAEESLEVLNSLRQSDLFRPDQYSYLLYPDRQLKRFLEKNNIPAARVQGSELLTRLIAEGDTSVVERDNAGEVHFHGSFRNVRILEAALKLLDLGSYGKLVEKEKTVVLRIYEELFDHQSFTGRSGTFYAYEGLGSIYWHMVSKLLLAAQECFFKSIEEGAGGAISAGLRDHYYDIKAGIGVHKSPEKYGAFPTDAYSHTPGNSGAKQPGMTGQVKEDIISRMKELGVVVEAGRVRFYTSLLNYDELHDSDGQFTFIAVSGKSESVDLTANQLAFTFCQVPVIYSVSSDMEIEVVLYEGGVLIIEGDTLDIQLSNMIFNRSGGIKQINVSVKPHS